MSRYNTNVAWSDPFEPKKSNQRDSERFKFRIKISITAQNGNPPQRLVGPGIVRNISVCGAWFVTKHHLEIGQKVVIGIPTQRFAVTDYLPAMFIGPAVVSRLLPDTDGRVWAGIGLETFWHRIWNSHRLFRDCTRCGRRLHEKKSNRRAPARLCVSDIPSPTLPRVWPLEIIPRDPS